MPLLPTPISDLDSEQLVIGTLLSGSAYQEQCLQLLTEACFLDQRLLTAMRAIRDVVADMQAVNLVSVERQLRLAYPQCQFSPYELAQLMAQGSDTNVLAAVEVLRQMAVRRELQTLATYVLNRVQDTTQPVEDVVRHCFKQLDSLDLQPSTPHCVSLSQIAPEVRQRIEDNLDPAKRHHGPLTGIAAIDNEAPLPETGLVVLAAGTSQGKSSLANRIALTSAAQGMPVAIYSLEMTNLLTVTRMVSMGTQGTSPMAIHRQPLTSWQYDDAVDSLNTLTRTHGDLLWFDDTRSTQIEDIMASIRHEVRVHRVRLVFVDYMQLLGQNASNRNETQEHKMATYSRLFKNLADRLGIVIVALSQLNRNMLNVRPSHTTIRDSGQIAEASDYVLMTWRPEAYDGSYDGRYASYTTHGTALAIVDKNREGPTMETLMGWKAKTTSFYSLSPEQLERMKKGAVSEGDVFE